ncbi:transcriptional repressor NrdR [Candidatus Woesearchaeota archaeon]|nr:transcriptional repressor NrdR [Candidatus Woesearchaeota archaeon]
MRCPFCLKTDTRVLDSRLTAIQDSIRRRRECPDCSKRFTTYERIEDTNVSVVKKNNVIEQFDRQKLITGMLKACEKRPVKRDKIEQAVDEIESELRKSGKTEITSRKLGEMVIDKLLLLDQVAYLRFASVYKRFTDINQFAKEVNKLKNRRLG